jgi:hypothetical protein
VLIAAGQPFRVALTDDLIGRVEKLLGRGAAAIG